MLFLDLDGFKQVNDTLGHDAGDEVLRVTAERLDQALRRHDVVTRLGGDEFVAVTEDVGDRKNAEEVAQRLLEATAAPIPVGGGEVTVVPSIGVTVVEPGAGGHPHAQRADQGGGRGDVRRQAPPLRPLLRRLTQPAGRSVQITVSSEVTVPSSVVTSTDTGNSGRTPASSSASTSSTARPQARLRQHRAHRQPAIADLRPDRERHRPVQHRPERGQHHRTRRRLAKGEQRTRVRTAHVVVMGRRIRQANDRVNAVSIRVDLDKLDPQGPSERHGLEHLRRYVRHVNRHAQQVTCQ